MARTSKGRQKIEMTKMSKESNLLVTFSKRRSGLFKKAYELHTLCGAEIGIIVFSPGKKVFSYGHPCLYTLIDRYMTGKAAAMPVSGSQQLVEAHRSASIRELNSQLTEIMNMLEMERKSGEELTRMRKASQGRCWWEAPPCQLGLPELEQLKAAMEELKKNVRKQAEKLIMEASSSTSFLAAPPPPGSNPSGGGGHVGPSNANMGFDAKVPTTMAPHGLSLGYGGRGFF